MRRITALLILIAAVPAVPAFAQDELPIPEIPFEKFVLDNGLTVVIHEDHKAPIVAVNVWYHVGSKNEVEGKTGFAHLFEHLMFNGSEHYDDDYFKPFDAVGATEMNGTTNSDRTNYFQNVPSTALDMVLWMESDRMCCMNNAVDQARLDEQRGVVQNEKRQGENQPYGEVFNLIQDNTYPDGHPYDHSVIGSMEDLNAASLDDVHAWFDQYYGPNNATLVIAGDVDTQAALEKVKHYFGGIEPSPPIERQSVWIAKREGSHRQIMQDRVPQARLYKVWNVPELTDPTADYLSLFADVLANGKNSRLYKKLVYDEQVATGVGAFVYGRELGSLFIVTANASPGQDLADVERMMDAEMRKLLAEGLTAEELDRARTGHFAGFIRGVERIGGFGGKSDVLASSEVYYGSPDGYRKSLRTIREATVQDVMAAARDWLQDGVYVLEVQPYPQLAAADTQVARADGPPMPEEFPEVNFTEYERTELENGLDVIVAQHSAVPVVEFALLVDAGYAADKGGTLGAANLALDMMDEGTDKMDALEIAATATRLGAEISLGSNLDTSFASLSALKANLEDSLELYADIVLHPTFPPEELERLRALQIAGIQQELAQPFAMALRLFPQLVYGADHAYSIPFTGTGTFESVKAMTREDLVSFHDTWFRPNNATMIVVGDTTLAEIRPLLEEYFAGWEPAEVPQKNIGPDELPETSTVHVVDRPGSEQAVIIAGHVMPPYDNPDKLALTAANEVLGGSFTARLNMNLRENKHWSYGARSTIIDARGPQPFFAYAPVQTDKAAESMAEIQKELEAIVTNQPPTPEEVQKVKNQSILTLPGRWETASSVLSSISEIVRFGLDENYWDIYPERVRALDVPAVTSAADEYIHPQQLVWVVVGDWSRIEEGVRALNLGEIELVKLDGNGLSEE
ncbi:MAG TPA: pitrilysin family protein [Woeseiaceae bacterium]|nr:pitrilysin family protein [Woeseiaceae bacterium]